MIPTHQPLLSPLTTAILEWLSIHIIEKLTRILGLIEDVAVKKNIRGIGVGKKLVEKLIQTGKAKKL